MSEYGGPGEIRTPDLTVRSRSLYPTELRAPKIILLQGLRIIVFAVIRHRPEWRFFTWNGVHFPVDENHIGVRPHGILSPDPYLHCPLE